jgi:starch phosphorylase
LPDALKGLDFIARNYFWVWTPEFVELFKRIDNKLWIACGHNPVRFLGGVSQERFEELTENQGFLNELNHAVEKLNSYLKEPKWFNKINSETSEPLMAYFSAEFGIHESLPIYSGGLGALAGDHMKSASDLGLPIVGVGLLYQKGYFRQYLNIDGWQQELYIENDFHSMPLELVRDSDGEPLTVTIKYPDENVMAQVWSVSVGSVQLYLLDSNLPFNSSEGRMITANLYGGDREMRIRQEIMLGIGGLRALIAMGINPTVCHMNEGHAAFMALEKIKQLRSKSDMTFNEALEATKAGNVFTIHTPVKAGLDEFSTELMDKYFNGYIGQLGIERKRFLGLGKNNPEDGNESFKMPILALRLSTYCNGVSKLHGEVSRKMWANLWPSVPINEIPITSVTNGIHVKSWLSEEFNCLYERYFGPGWEEEIEDNTDWGNVEQIPDEEIWRNHQRCKGHLIVFSRKRLKAQMQRRGTYHTELNWAEEVLDPEALTIGFARRFASYKRGNLLLRDPERLVKILNNPQKPVQIIFAGKAHPRDNEGKEIIRQIIHFASKYNVRRRIVFLEDYDINVARVLVRGVDVWLNTPRRPMEASGTSGMKAAINGALNLSTLDGWWVEGYSPEIGWVVGNGESYDDLGYQDIVESQAIYNLLENEVVPLYYTRAADDLPRAWIYRMKKCIKRITPRFSTTRMVREYASRFYLPADEKFRHFNADGNKRARDLANWKAKVTNAWGRLEIKDVQIEVKENNEGQLVDLKKPQLKVGSDLAVKVLIKLDRVAAEDISVELYHGPVDSWGNIEKGTSEKMTICDDGSDWERWFCGVVKCTQTGQYGLAVRVLPNHKDMIRTYDLGLILWETTQSVKSSYVTN